MFKKIWNLIKAQDFIIILLNVILIACASAVVAFISDFVHTNYGQIGLAIWLSCFVAGTTTYGCITGFRSENS